VVVAVILFCLSGVGYVVYGYVDIDGDGLTNNEEKKYHTGQYNADTDGDGLKDGEEINAYYTDPNNPDTDGDKLNDGIEIENRLNPLNSSDANADPDHDLISNLDEILKYHSNITNPNYPFPGSSDSDGDYVIRSIEIENGLDPSTKYSFGGLHDFLRLYGYTKRIPNNVSFQNMLNNATKYEPRYWEKRDGGFNNYVDGMYSELTLADPIFQYYADQVHIDWEKDPTHGKVGHLKLDDENLFLEYGTENSKPLVPPSYYLTHGRRGICVESSVANDCIFQHKEYPSTLTSAKINSIGHSAGEVKINDEVYIINYNSLMPKKDIYGEDTYKKMGWILGESYDPNWLVNGTDRHM